MCTIRKMTASDMGDVSSIISSHDSLDGTLAAAYYSAYFADARRDGSDREQNVVAVSQGVVLGVIGFAPDEYNLPDILWLNWFYVHPAHRGVGIGTRLLEHILTTMRQLCVRKAYLDTESGEPYAASVRLYGRFGFQVEGRLLDYYGKGRDCLIMGLAI